MTTNKIEKAGIHIPFFSVILTTYNRAGLLIRALDSLVSQTETDWEAIIIDDGSTDNTGAAVLPYLTPTGKIRYIRQNNAGYSNAKNAGIFLAKGKFVTFLDSDDEYYPTHLASRKMILQNDDSIQFLHGGLEIIGNAFVPDRFDHNKMIPLVDCVIAGTFFINREIAILFHGFNDIDLGSDGDLFERLEKARIHIMKTDIPTYIYHHETENSITNNFTEPHQFFKIP